MVHLRSGTVPSRLVSRWELYVHPRLRVTGSADQRVGGRRGAAPLGAAVVLLLCALVGIAPAGAAAATAGAGTVVGWGSNNLGQTSPPAGLTGVTAIAANGSRSLALKGDGTVVAWGSNWGGYSSPPTGLTGVTAIAAGFSHSLALKSDGTVVGWGGADGGDVAARPPTGLTGVTAIAVSGRRQPSAANGRTAVQEAN
jgi:hypothetical protein